MIAELPEPHPDIRVESAGTLGMVGAPASHLAVEVARDYGVDLSEHRSQALTPELLDRSDLIFAMARDHYEDCITLGANNDKLYLILHYPEHATKGKSASIPDPIGGDRKTYEAVYLQIDEALRRGLSNIVEAAKRAAEADSS
jgi:protein-tyrosine-phosphatase